MKARDILSVNRHRPWPLPRRPWIMRQVWHNVLFAHWPIPVQMLIPLLPEGLVLDTYRGQPWVGVVPFRMAGVRPRAMAAVPWLSAFPELNVRTYVVVDEKPGVFFFSLDAANPVAVQVARRFFALPYFNARMSCVLKAGTIHYISTRTETNAPEAKLTWAYRPVAAVASAAPESLAHWLTERYCLYTLSPRGNLLRGDIHHLPWKLQAAEAERRVNTMAKASGIELPELDPLLHYAERQDVLVWAPELVAPARYFGKVR